ncbi:MAG: hypothetical protein ACFHHU_00140 [Porticoccaceae bacterium]
MKKHSQPCTPRIVFEQPYGVHSEEIVKLLNDARDIDKQLEDNLNDRYQDRSE